MNYSAHQSSVVIRGEHSSPQRKHGERMVTIYINEDTRLDLERSLYLLALLRAKERGVTFLEFISELLERDTEL